MILSKQRMAEALEAQKVLEELAAYGGDRITVASEVGFTAGSLKVKHIVALRTFLAVLHELTEAAK
jgi:hypothetical protein